MRAVARLQPQVAAEQLRDLTCRARGEHGISGSVQMGGGSQVRMAVSHVERCARHGARLVRREVRLVRVRVRVRVGVGIRVRVGLGIRGRVRIRVGRQ